MKIPWFLSDTLTTWVTDELRLIRRQHQKYVWLIHLQTKRYKSTRTAGHTALVHCCGTSSQKHVAVPMQLAGWQNKESQFQENLCSPSVWPSARCAGARIKPSKIRKFVSRRPFVKLTWELMDQIVSSVNLLWFVCLQWQLGASVFGIATSCYQISFLAKLHATSTMKSPFAKLFSDLPGSKALRLHRECDWHRLTTVGTVGTEMQALCKPVKPVEKCKILLRNQRASVGSIATYAERASHFALVDNLDIW